MYFKKKYLPKISIKNKKNGTSNNISKKKKHPKEKEYYCECCDYKTEIKANYEKHLKTQKHQANLAGKVRKLDHYECPYCSKTSDDGSNMREHIKTHEKGKSGTEIYQNQMATLLGIKSRLRREGNEEGLEEVERQIEELKAKKEEIEKQGPAKPIKRYIEKEK